MTEAGLGTFVGRVRGQLTADDVAWIEASSDAVEDLRVALVDAADRLDRASGSLGYTGLPRPFDADVADADELTAWELLSRWADRVDALLVEAPSQGGEDLPARWIELGRALQEVRGEQIVDELLTAGVLVAPPGTTGAIAFAEHGAWDVELLGRGGATLARADVVIVADGAAVAAHLASRPGVDVVYTTSDAAADLVGHDDLAVVRTGGKWPEEPRSAVVVDIGVRSVDLRDEVESVLGPDSEHSADAVLEAVPALALLVVATRSAVRAAATDDAGGDITTDAGRQIWDVVTSAGVSQVVGWASGLNLLRVPATLTFSLGRAAVRDARDSVALSGRRVARARRLLAAVARRS